MVGQVSVVPRLFRPWSHGQGEVPTVESEVRTMGRVGLDGYSHRFIVTVESRFQHSCLSGLSSKHRETDSWCASHAFNTKTT